MWLLPKAIGSLKLFSNIGMKLIASFHYSFLLRLILLAYSLWTQSWTISLVVPTTAQSLVLPRCFLVHTQVLYYRTLAIESLSVLALVCGGWREAT